MCTAISFGFSNHYFGRNLDYEHTFGEKIIITPRNYKISFKEKNDLENHCSIIGVGIIKENYPLYFDCMNEYGLCYAGLNFPENAYYYHFDNNKDNITPYELPLWILGKCKSVDEAEILLRNLNLLNVSFNNELELSPLHFMFCDKERSIVYETQKEGRYIYDNPVGVLTNNPPFLMQLNNLNNYMMLSNTEPSNNFCKSINFDIYSRGMGAIGLPGDLSSQSRFVRACFNKFNMTKEKDELESITQFFHLLYSVYQQKGCVCLSDKKYEKTNYTTCYNTSDGFLYYTTYNNSRITKIDMHKEKLFSKELISYDFKNKQDILNGN